MVLVAPMPTQVFYEYHCAGAVVGMGGIDPQPSLMTEACDEQC
jgi:hypothetical protein